MAAYELFAATTTNLFIQNIKTKAEAYGWVIDFFDLYGGNNRLHLHNAGGAHFEIWYYSANQINISGCTGYNSGATPTSQPGVSAACRFGANATHLIAICKHSIFIKQANSSKAQNVQFGLITDKIGAWSDGIFVSGTYGDIAAYAFSLWMSNSLFFSQVLINGAWTTPASTSAGGVYGTCRGDLYTKMPFAYSGGILPCPLMLVRINPSTTAYRDPLGYAQDVKYFRGGDVYAQLEEITINGEVWLAVNQEELNGTFLTSPNLLLRLAE